MSYTGAMKALLETAFASPQLFKGCSPPPVPSYAEFPYITIQEIGGKQLESIDGGSGLIRVPMQLNHWDKDYDMAWLVRQSVRSFLAPVGSIGYKGNAGDEVIAGINHAGDHYLHEPERELHQLISTYMVWWIQ